MKVVHRRDPHTVYIGRPGPFGNPFSKYSRRKNIILFERHARQNQKLLDLIRALPAEAILGCWCAPRPCHGDVIVKLWEELHGSSSDS